jgi:dolichol-phosphate mannosyltransferase
VGISGILVNLATFIFLVKVGLNKFIASPLAVELSIINNFLWNNYWTFKDRNTPGHLLVRGVKFKGVSLLALGVSFTTFLLLSYLFPGPPAYVHQAIAIIPATAVNYFLNAYWTFKGQPGKTGQSN